MVVAEKENSEMESETINILLVEDEEAHAEAVKRAFRQTENRINLTWVSTIQEAFASLERSVPDLVIADWRLPDGKGTDLLPSAKGHFPLVLMTSHGNEELAVEAMKAGAVDYAVKSPSMFTAIPHIVERALRQWDLFIEGKRAVEQLRESEERFRTVFEQGPLGIHMAGLDYRFVNCNSAFCDIVGYSEQELSKLSFVDITHPQDLGADVEQAKKLLAGEMPFYKMEKRLVRKQGGIVWIQFTRSIIRDAEGNPLSFLTMIEDITERKRAGEAITAERQRLYDVLETLPVYVCLLDSDYRMPFANRYFREAFGESLGRRCHDFLFDRTEPCEICETFTVMKTREPHHWYWTGPNGRDYDIYDFPFIDTDGSFLILEMGIDITERKQAEDGLQQTLADLTRSNADLQQFAYVASHDLQEPLRNVASCLQLLEKKYKNNIDAKANQYIQYAVESSVRMKALIQDLLTYSRVGTIGQPPKQTDCEQVLDRTVKNLRSAISEAGAVITHNPLPTIFAEDAQLLQVFQNLIGNAIKFRRVEPPLVHVSAIKNKKEWIFSVKDNGVGIESRHLDRIFVIFQRLHKRSQYGGTGIGLAIVKKVVELHNGRVWVESEFGSGTTFYFTIPEKGTQT
jgi:PAS domain S-box-containing protein